jgi:hypothetical protein
MKTITTALLLALLCIAYLPVHAQFKQIAEGPKFEEPEEGFAKILQLKNGNTFYMHVTLTEGINVRIYDASHKEKVVTTFLPSYQELEENDAVEGVFEINDKVIVFVNKYENKLLTLYRLIIDGNTGKLSQDKIIAVSKNPAKYGKLRKPRQTDFFNIRKDPNSDNYAIAVYDESEGDRTKILEIIHYSGDHTELTRKFCHLPISATCNFLDMVVLGPEKICVFLAFTQQYEIKYHIMAVIEKGTTAINYTELTIPDQLIEVYKAAKKNLLVPETLLFGMAKYNPETQKIIFAEDGLVNYDRGEWYYLSAIKHIPLLYMIDPVTKEVQSFQQLAQSEKLHTEFKELLDEKKKYNGRPQDIIINDDGGFTILYEEQLFGWDKSGNRTELESIVVSRYDRNGKNISEYLVPKAQAVLTTKLVPFYISKRAQSAQLLFRGNQYKSFAYVDGIKSKYILFNDTEKNNDIKNARKKGNLYTGLSRAKLVMIIGVTIDCNAFMYKLTGDDLFPEREYLFAEKEKSRALALLTVSDYNKKNNTYVTLMLDKSNMKNKMVNIVWQEPD